MNLNFAFVFAAFLSVTQAAIVNRCQSNGVVALTFDDGPADYTGQLLNHLADKKVKATFHLTTQYLTDPSVQATIQRIAAEGHLVGLRTEPSWDLFQMSDDQIKASISRQANVMADFLGYYPKFIRLPYKKYDDRILNAIESTGAIVTVHNLETYDYTGDTTRILKAYQVSLNLAGKGAGNFISVQHDGVAASVSVVPQVIDLIRNLSYKIIKLDECLGLGDLTKNKKALEGGSGDYVPMEIDSSSGGLPSPSSGGSKGGNKAGKPLGGGKSSQNSGASAVAKPLAFTAVAAALLTLVFAL